MSKQDNRQELGRLINEHLVAEGLRPADITKKLPEKHRRSFFNWKNGSMAPRSNDARVELEDALGWKRGVVTDILEASITRTFELSEVRDWGQVGEPPVARASELSTVELVAELSRRVLEMDERLTELGEPGEVIRLHSHKKSPEDQRALRLAASSTEAGRNMEHLENEEDEDR